MTQLAELPVDRVQLNPGVPVPPFPVWLGLPGDWSLLDTNPGTWRRSADSLIDDTFHGARLPAAQRREVVGFFEQLVADCQRSGAAISLIKVGQLAEGGAASVGIHLAFGDEGVPSSLARVRDLLPRTGSSAEIDSGVGPAVLHRDRMTMIPPGATTVVALTSMQVFIPIPDTTWTAILATATAFAELTEPMERMLRRIAAGFRLTETTAPVPAGDADDAGDRADSHPDGWSAAPRQLGPGIEKGFGTMVTRRLQPPDDEDGS